MIVKKEILELLKKPKSQGGLNQIQESGFKKLYPELHAEFTGVEFPEGFTFRQKMFHFLQDDCELELGLCKKCGKRCAFTSMKDGYNDYCSNSCAQSAEENLKKRRQTCLEKYGSETYNNREKSRQTCMNTYGTDNPQKTEAVSEKSRKTRMEKYGNEHYNNSAKTKQTKLERYGDEHYNNTEKNKITCMDKYGVGCVFQSEEIKERIIETNLEKYGVEHPMQCEEIQDKAKRTSLEKYGVEYPSQTSEFRKAVEETNLKKYGVKCNLELDEVKEKIKATCMEKYGVEYSMQSPVVRQKAMESNLKRFGTPCSLQANEVKEKSKATCMEKYGVEYSIQSDEVKEKIKASNLEKYGVEWFCMTEECKRNNGKNNSRVNQNFSKLLTDSGIEHEREFPLEHYSYDFKIGDTLVEINPTISHNTVLNIYGAKPLDKNYHLEKTNTAKRNGYKCVHVWDWDDAKKVVGMFFKKEVLHARKLSVKIVEKTDAVNFFDNYHLQGSCKGILFCVGLFLNDYPIELMAFGKPRYNGRYEWELLRLCTRFGYAVVGGAERLFEAFAREMKPKSVISYCDNSKFDGLVYERLGFVETGTSNPSKHWCRGSRHITDNLLRQRGFDQLFGACYGKGTSNEELILAEGFLPVFDCGQRTFAWSDNKKL